jgi:hypothetical protein
MLNRFKTLYKEKAFESIGSDEVYGFLENLTQGLAKLTQRLRYAQLKAFFNLVINRCDQDIKNPGNTSLLSKTFRSTKQSAGNLSALLKNRPTNFLWNIGNPIKLLSFLTIAKKQ